MRSSGFAPENACEPSAIEWWFFQGDYEQVPGERHHFMVSLFRSNLGHPWFREWRPQARGQDANGFQLIVTTLDPAGQHHSATWIDSGVLLKAVSDLPHIDPEVQRAIAQELESWEETSHVVVKAPPQHFCPAPLGVTWESFSLRQDDDGFHLTFARPGCGESLTLSFTSTGPGVEIGWGHGMAYRTYPWLALKGGLPSGAPLIGRAWMDHQWGDTAWFYDVEGRALLGWDWFGFNLEDGSAWLIMTLRNAQTSVPVSTNATQVLADGATRSTRRVVLTALRSWVSPHTQTSFPIAWRMEISEFEADLVFEPLSDHQEVAAFGVNRSLWEGAGTVAGTIASRAVRGPARGEFRGYGLRF